MLSQKKTVSSSKYRVLLNLFGAPAPPSPPTASITSFGFAGPIGTTSAQPSVVVANTNATSLSWTLYHGTGTSDSGYSVYSTGTATPTGSNTITSPLATDIDRWYYYSITVTNVAGSTTVSTSHLQNLYTPPPPPAPTASFRNPMTFKFPGESYAQPFISVDITETTSFTWSLYEVISGSRSLVVSEGPFSDSGPTITIYDYADITPNGFFQFGIVVTGPGGSVTEYSSVEQNLIPA